MNKYCCKCPVPGCDLVFEDKAGDWESAYKKMYELGKRHIIEKHPDFPEPANREACAKKYIEENMVME